MFTAKQVVKKNITYIISNINKALAFEWIATNLDKERFNLSFILLNESDSALELFLKTNNISVSRVRYRSKKDTVQALLSIRKILKKEKTDIVHAHLFEASIIGLSAARTAGIKRRIYTRHHSTYHHVYYPHAVKYDRLCNFLATDIIAISKNVLQVLLEKERVDTEKVTLIHHGFALEQFDKVSPGRIEKVRGLHNPAGNRPVIGVIARYTEWKGIQFIIPAFRALLADYPNALLVLANAGGDHQPEIHRLLNSIPARNYREIVFENDIFALYKLFDVFVHVPVDAHSEAFGQTYVEALASGIPSIFTRSGISEEFIVNNKNALVVPFQDEHAILTAMKELLAGDALRKNLSVQGKEDVGKLFYLDKMIRSLEALYER